MSACTPVAANNVCMMGDIKSSSWQDLKDIKKALLKLRDLLTNALPDDLLDDDTASFSSNESNGSMSQHHGGHLNSSHDPWEHYRNQLPAQHRLIQQQQQQTSTPNGYSNPPPLKTPAPTPWQNGHGAKIQNDQHFAESSDDESLGQCYEQRGQIVGAASDEDPRQSHPPQTQYQILGNEYANQDGIHVDQHRSPGISEYEDQGDYQNGYQHGDHEYANEDTLQNGGFEDGDYQMQTYGNHLQQYQPPHHQVNKNNQNALHSQQTYAGDILPSGHHENNHRVQYRGDSTKPYEMLRHDVQSTNGFPDGTNQTTMGNGQHDAGDQLQNQFMAVGGDDKTRQISQLQILYKARGRELDHLTNQLQTLKEESGRQQRILNHQLALTQGEKAGAVASLEQCQELLAECQQENRNLKGQLQAAQAQVQALNTAKLEVEEKLQSTESAIGSLTSQLTELHRSQPLARAREQQDGLLRSLQERYDQEVVRLKEKVDNSERSLEEKCNELGNFRQELAKVGKAADQAKLEHGQTINSLTNQLHDSQKQCRELLQTGSLQEVNLLRVQLKDATAARTFNQDMTSALQEEIAELKGQLQMYEAAMELGAITTKSPESSQQSKSFAVRNLARSDWKTPQSNRPVKDSSPESTQEDLIQGLRKEIERSLQSNRTKRNQVSKLQADARVSKTEMENLRKEMAEVKTVNKDREVRIRVLESQLETTKSSPTADITAIRQLREELAELRTERNELAKKLEVIQDEEKRLDELNSELKTQMAQMVAENDQDKKIDMERVQKTCLQLHEDSSRHLREELIAEFQSERDMLKEAHEHQLQQLRSELEQVQKELDEVKGLYIDVCEEKNDIEDTVTKAMKADADKQLQTAKESWQTQHGAVIQELRESLESSQRAAMVTAKNAWKQEAEEEMKKTVEEKLALAKVEWSEAVRKDAVKSALAAADAECKVKMETELEKRLEQAKTHLEASHQDHLMQQKEQLETKHKADKAEAIQTALALAETDWMLGAESDTKDKINTAIEMAKEQWMKENPDKRLEEAISAARREWTNQRVDWEKVKEDWLQEHGEKEIAKRVSERTSSLESKHLKDISNLRGVLEKSKQKMKQDMESEKLTVIEDVKNRLEMEHKQALDQALKRASEQADKLRVQSLEKESSKWQSRLDKMQTSQQAAISKAVKEAQDEWLKEKDKMKEAEKALVASLQAESVADQEELRSQFEAELERGIEEAVKSARQQWTQNCDAELRKACDEILERKEQGWHQERADLQEQLNEATSHLRDSQRQAERHRKKHALSRQKLEKEIESLKEQLQDGDRELRQTEYSLRRELQQLQARLQGASTAAVEALEAKMVNMQKKYEAELEEARWQIKHSDKTTVSITTQTVVNDDDDNGSSEALQEIKAHYIRTVKKIKVDVMKRMRDMRENCRHTVHTEVMKERHSTAKKLRRYYLQCLQQFLEDDSNHSGNDNSKAQSTASKLAAMARALQLPPDQLIQSHPYTKSAQESPSESISSSNGSVGSKDEEHATHKEQVHVVSAPQGSSAQGRYLANVGRGLDSSSVPNSPRNNQNKLPSKMDGTDGGKTCTSPDQSTISEQHSWGQIEAEINLDKLPTQPREFNPKPERLPSNSRDTLGIGSSERTSSTSARSINKREMENSAESQVKGILEKRSKGEPLYKAGLKSRERSMKYSSSDDGQLRKSVGSNSSTSSKCSTRDDGSRESSPDTMDDGHSSRWKQLESCSNSDKMMQKSSAMRPITDGNRGVDTRKGPLRVPQPTEKIAAMLASVPLSASQSMPHILRHGHIPSPGPKATDISTASLDTVYNDLPASLGSIPDYQTLDNPTDLARGKVVRFQETSRGQKIAKRSQTDQFEYISAKSSNAKNTRANKVSTFPAKIDLGIKGPSMKLREKLVDAARHDSGFLSPRTEVQS